MESDAQAFSPDNNGRAYIEQVSSDDFIQALLEHVVKLDALYGISNIRFIDNYSATFSAHTIGETELRLYSALKVSVDDVLNATTISNTVNILKNDRVALLNIIESFVDYRYIKAKANDLDTSYLNDEIHKQIIWKIDEYFNSLKSGM